MKIRLTKVRPVQIVGDGLVSSTERGEGRFIPVLILNTADRPDIDELLRVHQNLPPGDVVTQWSTVLFAKESIVLNMRFIKPMSCKFGIAFDPYKYGVLIDAILYAQALYFLSGKVGDQVSSTTDKPKILAEVPRLSFLNTWNKRYLRIASRRFRLNGLDRTAAKRAAREMIESIREMWEMRRG